MLRTALLCLLFTLATTSLCAQERAGGSKENSATVNDQIRLQVLTELLNQINQNYHRSCNGHANGSTWTETCPNPFTGTNTYTCLSSVKLLRDSTCQ